MSDTSEPRDVYRCGPYPDCGCDHVFDVEINTQPRRCPRCGGIFCGEDCCGNVAEYVGRMNDGDEFPHRAGCCGVILVSIDDLCRCEAVEE